MPEACTELIDRKKMRGEHDGSDCRLMEHHTQPVTTLGHVDCGVVAGRSSVTPTALLAHPSSPTWGPEPFILAGRPTGRDTGSLRNLHKRLLR